MGRARGVCRWGGGFQVAKVGVGEGCSRKIIFEVGAISSLILAVVLSEVFKGITEVRLLFRLSQQKITVYV